MLVAFETMAKPQKQAFSFMIVFFVIVIVSLLSSMLFI